MSDDIGKYLNDLPYRSEWVIGKDGKLANIEHNTPLSSKLLENAGRHHVQVRYNGVPLNYYLSSGQSPKEGVFAGRWYPVFGIGEDGWVNKGPTKDLANYYGNKNWADIGRWLDARIGDIRDSNVSGTKQTDIKRGEFSQRSGVNRARVTFSDPVWREGLNRGYAIGVEHPAKKYGKDSPQHLQYLQDVADRASGRWTPTPAHAGGGMNLAMLNQYRAMSSGTRNMFIPKVFE